MKQLHKKSLFILPALLCIHTVQAKDINLDNKIQQDIRPALCKLDIKKTHEPKYFTYGENGVYRISVSNPHRFLCSRVVIRDTLPRNMNFISQILPSPWNCSVSNGFSNRKTLTCNLNHLRPRQSVELAFRVRLPEKHDATGTGWSKNNDVKNCANVKGYRYGYPWSISSKSLKRPPFYPPLYLVNTSCDTAKIKVPVKECKLSIKKTNEGNFTYGNTATYKISFTNELKEKCNIRMYDHLPNNVTIDTVESVSNPNINCSASPDTKLECTGTLSGGASADVSFTVNLPTKNDAVGSGWIGENDIRNCAKITKMNHQNGIEPRVYAGCDTTTVQEVIEPSMEFCRADVELVLDRSGSMKLKDGGTMTRLERVKEAASYFAEKALSFAGASNRVGVTQFNHTSQLLQTLTTDYSAVSSAILSMYASGGTNIHKGLQTGMKDLIDNSIDAPRILLLLTDGLGYTDPGDVTVANDNNIHIYTIAYGDGANTNYLENLALDTNGSYQQVPVDGNLTKIFTQVANNICSDLEENKTTEISGLKFHDANGDGVQNTGEGPLADIPIQLYPATSSGIPTGGVIEQTVTATDGTYSFTDVPAGTYIVKEDITVLQDWTQTFPAANNGCHTITLAEGQKVGNLNFGNANCNDLCDATVSGFKYHDKNRNGKFDKGEKKLSNWLFELIHQNGTSTFATTDANGNFTFNISHDLLSETIKLEEWLQPGWVAVSPTNGKYANIHVNNGDSLTYNFANSTICNMQRSALPDVEVVLSKKNQLIVKNIGKAATSKMGLLISNTHDIKSIRGLKRWKCSANKAMNQISCKYKGILETKEEMILSLPVSKMKHTRVTVFAEYDKDRSNNQIDFSEPRRK